MITTRRASARRNFVNAVLFSASLALPAPGAAQSEFRRADANLDTVVDISDPTFVLGYLFLGSAAPACLDAADSNDDGAVDISDATFSLGFLFLGTAPPPAPGPSTPGPDPTADALACGDDPGAGPWNFVTSRIILPATPSQVSELAFNLDGDGEGRLDNALGTALALVAQSGVNPQGDLQAAIDGGRIVLLHTLDANNLAADATATWRAAVGEDAAPPIDLSGNGEFILAGGAPAGLAGAISAGRFTGGPGAAQIEIAAHPSVTIVLDLAGARVEADVSEEGCRNARIGGGITREEIDTALIPGLAATFQASIDEDPGSETSRTLLSFYDDDQDGRIDTEDLRANSVLNTLLAVDVDLLDASGAFLPLADGAKDSLSIAVGFECVRARVLTP